MYRRLFQATFIPRAQYPKLQLGEEAPNHVARIGGRAYRDKNTTGFSRGIFIIGTALLLSVVPLSAQPSAQELVQSFVDNFERINDYDIITNSHVQTKYKAPGNPTDEKHSGDQYEYKKKVHLKHTHLSPPPKRTVVHHLEKNTLPVQPDIMSGFAGTLKMYELAGVEVVTEKGKTRYVVTALPRLPGLSVSKQLLYFDYTPERSLLTKVVRLNEHGEVYYECELSQYKLYGDIWFPSKYREEFHALKNNLVRKYIYTKIRINGLE